MKDDVSAKDILKVFLKIGTFAFGLGTAKVTFDVLFNMLVALGLHYRVVTKKAV
jgi:hypothetical protein